MGSGRGRSPPAGGCRHACAALTSCPRHAPSARGIRQHMPRLDEGLGFVGFGAVGLRARDPATAWPDQCWVRRAADAPVAGGVPSREVRASPRSGTAAKADLAACNAGEWRVHHILSRCVKRRRQHAAQVLAPMADATPSNWTVTAAPDDRYPATVPRAPWRWSGLAGRATSTVLRTGKARAEVGLMKRRSGSARPFTPVGAAFPISEPMFRTVAGANCYQCGGQY